MDRATEESLLFSADSIPTSRILQILTYRTGYRHPLGERTYHTRILLTALPAEHTVRMAEGVLGTENLPPDLATLIIHKAEGNPFSTRPAASSLMRRPPHDGQNPRPRQLKATTVVSPQRSHRTRSRPYSGRPHLR
jgi:hypothetical protein